MSISIPIRIQKYTNVPDYLKNNLFARPKLKIAPTDANIDMVELLLPGEKMPSDTTVSASNLLSFSSRLASVFISKPMFDETIREIKNTDISAKSVAPANTQTMPTIPGHPAFGKIIATNYIEEDGVLVPIMEDEGMKRKKTMFMFKPDDNVYYTAYGFQSEPNSNEIKFVLSHERVKREYQKRPNAKLVYKKRMVFHKTENYMKAWDTIIMSNNANQVNPSITLDGTTYINMNYIQSEVEREYGRLDENAKKEKETAMITMYYHIWKTISKFNGSL